MVASASPTADAVWAAACRRPPAYHPDTRRPVTRETVTERRVVVVVPSKTEAHTAYDKAERAPGAAPWLSVKVRLAVEKEGACAQDHTSIVVPPRADGSY